MFPKEMMLDDSVWMDRLSYVEAEEHYQLYLNKNLTVEITQSHAETLPVSSAGTHSPLVDEIASARASIKQSLSGMTPAPDHSHVTKLANENKELRKLVADLSSQLAALELRVGKLEVGAPKEIPKPEKDEEEDDFDLFGDDDESEEETEEEKKKKEELLAKYHEKKSKKPALVAKSNIILDIKPWDDETDMVEMERLVRTVELDGMIWGLAKLVPLAYGIKKLQISCVVEDEKVGSEDLSDKIIEFENHVQSVDVAAFNKI